MALGSHNIEFRDNTDEILKALEEAARRGLEAIGLAAEGHAKKALTDQKAVDTGRLRNSVTYAMAGELPHVKQYRGYKRAQGEEKRAIYEYKQPAPGDKDDGVYIGTNVEYGAFVELGTSKSPARPFLRPAATEHTTEYKRLMEESMKNA